MPKELCKLLKKEYGFNGKISFYGPDKKMNLLIEDSSFSYGKELITFKDIRLISKYNFDGFCMVRDGRNFGQSGALVLLNPFRNLKREQYLKHYFLIPRFESPLEMEISFGKGKSLLTEIQREKYFSFVKSIYEKFKENSL